MLKLREDELARKEQSLKTKNADHNRASLEEQIRTLQKRVNSLEGAMDEIYAPAKCRRYRLFLY